MSVELPYFAPLVLLEEAEGEGETAGEGLATGTGVLEGDAAGVGVGFGAFSVAGSQAIESPIEVRATSASVARVIKFACWFFISLPSFQRLKSGMMIACG